MSDGAFLTKRGKTTYVGPTYVGPPLRFVDGVVLTDVTVDASEKTREKAAIYDEGKEPLSLLPWAAVDVMSRVQAHGAKKYGDFHNYRKGLEVSRQLSCVLRHVRDYMNGVDTDPESGESPLGHAMTRLGFVLQTLADGTAIDDRHKQPEK